MEKIIYLFLLAGLLAFSSTIKADGFAGGTGTIESPYLIADLDQLNNMRTTCVSATAITPVYYKLTADIDLSGVTNWLPISYSNNNSGDCAYMCFDGDGHIIKNMTSSNKINEDGSYGSSGYAGFAGVLIGFVKNTGFVNVNVKSDGAGAIAGYVGKLNATGTDQLGYIENCYVTGKVSGVGKLGGIAGCLGKNGSYLRNCYSTCDVYNGRLTGNDYTGGIAGIVSDAGTTAIGHSYVENCYATGNIYAGHKVVGGIVGWSDAYIRNCVSLNKSIKIGSETTATTDAEIGTIVGHVGGYDISVGSHAGNIAKDNIEMIRCGVAYSAQNFNTGIKQTPVDGTIKDGEYLSNAINYYQDRGFAMAGENQVWAQNTYLNYPQLLWVSLRSDADLIDGLHEIPSSNPHVSGDHIKMFTRGHLLNVSGVSGEYELKIYTIDGKVAFKNRFTGNTEIPFTQNGIHIVSVIANDTIRTERVIF